MDNANTFTGLPNEIRLQILAETGLVRWRGPLDERSSFGLDFENGTLQPVSYSLDCTETRSACCCATIKADIWTCLPVPTSLFSVSKLMNREARFVFFSRNQFTFRGTFQYTTQFLSRLSSADIGCIRNIVLEMRRAWDIYRLSNYNEQPRQDWDQSRQDWCGLIQIILERCRLPKLWLTVDAVYLINVFELRNHHDGYDDYAHLHTGTFHLFEGLRQLKGKGLLKLHVRLGWFVDSEAVIEKEVMGPSYDSVAEGKLTWDFPAGAPLSILQMPYIEALAER